MSEQEQADRLEWILGAHRENLTERSTAITDAQDRWLLCREVVRLRSELESLRAIVAHLPETADENPEYREPIVPGRRYWVPNDDYDPEYPEDRLCNLRCYSYLWDDDDQVFSFEDPDLPCFTIDYIGNDRIYSRHPETGERAETINQNNKERTT